MKLDCECSHWAMECLWDTNEHHPNCVKYSGRNERYFIIKLLHDLVKGMDEWASDEDGIHPEAWDAYKRARAVLLNPMEEKN